MADSPRIEELRRRVQSDPASIAFAALAEEYRRAGRFDEAIDTCNVGLVRHPSYLSAHVTLGRALIDVGRLEEARGALQYVLKLAPENLAAIRGLAEIHDRLGEAFVKQEESAALEPAGPTMTVEEIHAASGFTRPEAPDPAPEPSNVSDPVQVEPVIEQSSDVYETLPPSALADPTACEEPAPVDMPAVAAQVVDVEPTLIEPPALAGLEEFLNAILRARAERVAAR
jgi:tetratricopeptide (TPR) repeat protein